MDYKKYDIVWLTIYGYLPTDYLISFITNNHLLRTNFKICICINEHCEYNTRSPILMNSDDGYCVLCT